MASRPAHDRGARLPTGTTLELVDHTLLIGSPACTDYDATATPLVVHRNREHGVGA
ncbi:hypothetical protein JHN63_17825 [Streptomyces sp. MBT65]|uniref:hypothetical protein n=1 Tax=Streptomyces sp. MBT65 TaxID=1488395 RepID=UPI00190D0A00|nr:hypothetical protein [Streptomyces sp. MBT65]MBK3575640.1 hypothetical protein [Streptomyces sp. MBT65]